MSCNATTTFGKPCPNKGTVEVAGKLYCKRHVQAAEQAIELEKIRNGTAENVRYF